MRQIKAMQEKNIPVPLSIFCRMSVELHKMSKISKFELFPHRRQYFTSATAAALGGDLSLARQCI